jgi:hypothetical protein
MLSYEEHNGALPAHAGVPTLKIPLGKPKHHEQPLMTPRSMAAAEKAVAEQEAMAAKAEAIAAVAAEEAADAVGTPREAAAVKAAVAAANKAHTIEHAVAKSQGVFELVVQRGWSKYEVLRYATDSDARQVAATLWGCWIIYHEQRGSRTEIAYGGFGWAHGAMRRFMHSNSSSGLNMLYGRMGQ